MERSPPSRTCLPVVRMLGKKLRGFQRISAQVLDGQVAYYRFVSAPTASTPGTAGRDIVLGEKERGKSGIKDRLKVWIRTAPLLRKAGLLVPKIALRWGRQEDVIQGFNYLIISNRPTVMYVENAAALCNYNLTSLTHPLPRAVIRLTLRRPGVCLVAMSHLCHRGLTSVFPWLERERLFQIYPAVPKNPFAPAPAPARSDGPGELTRFLFVASQFHLKGGKELIRAFAELCRERTDVRLTLITSAADVGPEWMAKIRENGSVELHEPKYDLITLYEQFYGRSQVLVHPTKFDSFALVVLESIHSGLAVIASKIGAIPEMVKNGENGYVYEGGQDLFDDRGAPDPEHWYENWAQTVAERYDGALEEFLVKSMRRLADDHDLCGQMGRCSFEMASNPPFSQEYIADQWRNVYDSILGE